MSFRDLSFFLYPATLRPVASPRSIIDEQAANLLRRACRNGESIMVSSKARTRIGFRSGIPGIALLIVTLGMLLSAAPAAFAAGGTCPAGADYMNSAGSLVTLASLGITNCYYFSKSTGSDSNSGTSESSPQAHLPGMPSYTGSITPAAGQGFILKGGDTWVASDMPLHFAGSGNSSNPVYVGVDLGWFSGASWSHPKFDCQATQCGHSAQVQISGGNYVILDNIEGTGVKSDTSEQKYVENLSGDHNIIERWYCHGWSHGTGSFTDTGNDSCYSDNASTNSTWLFNICDGSDTSKDMKNCMRVGGLMAAYNYSQFTYEGLHGHVNDVHGNNFGNFILDSHSGGGDHANGIVNNLRSGTVGLIYNNVVHDDRLAAGMEDIWVCGAGTGDCTGDTIWVFGNVTYNVGRGIDVGDHPPSSAGTVNAYNNTIGNLSSTCIENGESPARTTVNFANNHCIIPSGSVCGGAGVTCNNLGNNLQQTSAQANANTAPKYDQYTMSERYVWSPAASTNSTVGVGQNLTSSCSGSVAALCNDTTYATENTSNHTVVLRTTNARGGTWDIGAFEYGTQGPPPNPPTGLAAIVQ
jgi:hypothetical protein